MHASHMVNCGSPGSMSENHQHYLFKLQATKKEMLSVTGIDLQLVNNQMRSINTEM